MDAVSTVETGPATGEEGTPSRRRLFRARDELKGTAYELFILLVSLLSFANTVIVLLPMDWQIRQVAFVADLMISPVLVVDFLFRFATARSRSHYVLRQFGWADLLSASPLLGFLRVFRIVRTVRLMRMRGRDQLYLDVSRDRARSTFLLTLFLVLAVVEFAGMAIYVVESPLSAANIKTPSDAIWWGFVTITTVGYGDRYPVSNEGRVIGTLLLFAGIALFSVLTGFIANAFLAPRAGGRLHRPRPGSLEADLEELHRMLIEQEQRAASIRVKLEEIERRRDTRMLSTAAPGTDDDH
jgi:voltage-gated potassium channel